MDGNQVDFNAIIGNVLRYGVTISTALLVVGAIMILAGDKSPNFPESLVQVVNTDYGRPTLNFVKLASEVANFNPVFIIQLGLLILLATPIVRVAASILLFAAEEDVIYVAVTVFVLTVLLFSIFVIGPIEAA
ncbi:MAG: DUF1634 domain-containing protein [Thaumarchaeota archaeon]|nr:DUF1634 domain-containing protein [Nitrososphaerota archaeon]